MSNIFDKVYDEKWMNNSKNEELDKTSSAMQALTHLIDKDKTKDNID